MASSDQGTAVKVAVRIRPLNEYELIQDGSVCLDIIPGRQQIRAGENTYYTFDNVFGTDTAQDALYQECVVDLLNAAFEGFNATILAYGQTGSGKTYTMGSSSDMQIAEECQGIIPRVIRSLFMMISEREKTDSRSTYRVHVQFLEIYGEDIKDLLDQTRTSKVSIREMRNGEVFVTGAKEEFVSSFEQMMKALEDGTRNRTTAATKMNQTSSRSHAIFTVILEHTILTEADPNAAAEGAEVDAAITQEVRKSKFHFVDLAGSERAKRTGAQGQQMKEGIDINKGLLALGNVISALGDEGKRGKVFVPYRDSRLTRMLQDSLGGNSKTLMICCVSPAASNFNESMNALRYANRARNIKNMPVVNRDPTLIIIDELRGTLKAVAAELLEIRTRKQVVEIDSRITTELLQDIVSSSSTHAGTKLFRTDSNVKEAHAHVQSQANQSSSSRTAPIAEGTSSNRSSSRPTSQSQSQQAEKKAFASQIAQLKQELADLQVKLAEGDFELKRQIEHGKTAKKQVAELADQVLFTKSERDFFKMRWMEACPQEAKELEEQQPNGVEMETILDPASSLPPPAAASSSSSSSSAGGIAEEQRRFMRVVAQHLREIEDLKQQLAFERSRRTSQQPLSGGPLDGDVAESSPEIDHEFTATMSSLIAQARSHLQEECRRLKTLEGVGESTSDAEEEEGSPSALSAAAAAAATRPRQGGELEMEKAFAKRQRYLSSEVQELGQSIQLKEQLMEQLLRSQQQYDVMKHYYEHKLSALADAMKTKQEERDRLISELQEVSGNRTEAMVAREAKLLEDLRAKEDDLREMKKKQVEYQQLTQTQVKYTQQVAKLQADIVEMKKHRVDLAKTLQQEKKSHLLALNEKAKEIESLKRQLMKSASEVKKLGRDKEVVENRMKDALREGAALKKKAMEAAAAAAGKSTGAAGGAGLALALPVPPAGSDQSVASTKEALRMISKSSARWTNKRMLSEQELRTKRWIDQRIAEITAREAAAEALKKQYEQQLELLTRKEALEKERSQALAHVEHVAHDPNQSEEGVGRARLSSGNKGEDEEELPGERGEEEALLEMIEERLSSINGQLNVRSQRISDIRARLMDSQQGSSEATVTVDMLKNMAAGNLPASHDLIRLLMDMLIHANRTVKAKVERLEEQQEQLRNLQQRLDDATERLSTAQHAHDKEVTKLNQEYEAKLHELFKHVSTLHDHKELLARAASPSSSSSSAALVAMSDTMHSHLTSSSEESKAFLERKKSIDPMELQLAISLEENLTAKSQLQREAWKYAQLSQQFEQAERIKHALMRDLEEKNRQIRFLEEDRALFQEMAEGFKASLQSMGREGKQVVENIKDRVKQSSQQAYLPLHSRQLHSQQQRQGQGQGGESDSRLGSHTGLLSVMMMAGSDDEEDTKSVLGEFASLGEEISRTGWVQSTRITDTSKSLETSRTTESRDSAASASGGSGANIYDRLSNPSYYTGSMKTVFNKDIETLRQRTARIRNQEKRVVSTTVPVASTGLSSKRNADGVRFFPPESTTELVLQDISTDDVLQLDLSSPTVPRASRIQSLTRSAPKSKMTASKLRLLDDVPSQPTTPPSSGQPSVQCSDSPSGNSSPVLASLQAASASDPPHIWATNLNPREKQRMRSPKTTQAARQSNGTSAPPSPGAGHRELDFPTDGTETSTTP